MKRLLDFFQISIVLVRLVWWRDANNNISRTVSWILSSSWRGGGVRASREALYLSDLRIGWAPKLRKSWCLWGDNVSAMIEAEGYSFLHSLAINSPRVPAPTIQRSIPRGGRCPTGVRWSGRDEEAEETLIVKPRTRIARRVIIAPGAEQTTYTTAEFPQTSREVCLLVEVTASSSELSEAICGAAITTTTLPSSWRENVNIENKSPGSGLEGGGDEEVLPGAQLHCLQRGAGGANDIDPVVGREEGGGRSAGGEHPRSQGRRSGGRITAGTLQRLCLILLGVLGGFGWFQWGWRLEDGEIEAHIAACGPVLDIQTTGDGGWGS
jgi:hypothetical protein